MLNLIISSYIFSPIYFKEIMFSWIFELRDKSSNLLGLVQKSVVGVVFRDTPGCSVYLIVANFFLVIDSLPSIFFLSSSFSIVNR